jgi:hypothetical protein
MDFKMGIDTVIKGSGYIEWKPVYIRSTEQPYQQVVKFIA